MKKSEGTGSGLKDIYVPKWRHFEECSFLEDVIVSNQATLSNTETPRTTEDCSQSIDDDRDETNYEMTAETENQQQPPKRKKNKQELDGNCSNNFDWPCERSKGPF